MSNPRTIFQTSPTEAELDFRRMMNNSPVFIWMSNITGSTFFFNNAWLAFTGQTESEAGSVWFDLIHPEDRTIAIERFRKNFAAHTIYRAEYRLRHRDGTYHWILSYPAPYYNSQNQFAGFISSCFDCNEQHILENTLATRALKQAALASFGRFALSPHTFVELTHEAVKTTLGILRVDCVLLVSVNLETRELTREAIACNLGSNPPHNLGPVPAPALDYTHPILLSEDPENFPTASITKAAGINTALACPIGSGKQLYGYILANTRAHRAFSRDAIEFIQGIANILATVNQRDRAEKALAASEQRLLQSQKTEAIGLLAGGLAHDFKNLLTVIRGYTELLQKDISQLKAALPSTPAAPQTSLAAICTHNTGIINATERAGRLTRQLLAFSRGQTVQPESVDLNLLVLDIKELITAFLRSSIRLELILAPDPATAYCDRNQIEQVILNLAINARDAMPEGGCLTISTSNIEEDENTSGAIPQKGPCARITVRDTGTGIPPEIQPKIFIPFFTTKTRNQGTGLGLPTCANIIKNAGGTLTFETALGQGTAFIVTLPAFAPIQDNGPKISAQATFLDAHDTHSLSPAFNPDTLTGTETLLLVEDDPSIREVTTAILESLGYTVRVHATADALLAACAGKNNPAAQAQLLITDINMPGTSGRLLAERMRTIQPNLRVLFISGFINESSHNNLYLEKPFTRDALAQKVREAISRPPAV